MGGSAASGPGMKKCEEVVTVCGWGSFGDAAEGEALCDLTTIGLGCFWKLT